MNALEGLDFLESLYIMHAGYFAHPVDDVLQMLQVSNVENYIYVGLAIGGTGFNIANVGLGVADDCGDLLQHAKPVIAVDRQLYRI
jgi:hypothetical protein